MIREREAQLIAAIDDIADALDKAKDMTAGAERFEAVATIARRAFNARELARDIKRFEGMPDDMPAGWNRPAPASYADVQGVLEDAAERVAMGDSFEGTITWEMPYGEPELEGADFGLIARYRVGNMQGQGFVRVFTPGSEE